MKYDKHHIEKIVESLRNGDGRVRACKIANISYETFMRWINSQNEFYEAIKKAEDVGNDKLKDIHKRKILEDKSWQSGAWWLERNYPDEFRNRQSLEHQIGISTIDFSKLTPEEAKIYLELKRKAKVETDKKDV